MWRKILDELSGRNCEFKERMFRAVILAGGVTAIVAILEILFVNDIMLVIAASHICHNGNFHVGVVIADNCTDVLFIAELPFSEF